MANPKRPRDPNQLAHMIVGIAVGDVEQESQVPLKGAAGGRKGGPARAAKLTAEERAEIARKAAATRWDKPKS